MTEKIKAFEQELKYIKSDKIRQFAEKAIETMTDYFFVIPASSTGKYHPNYALGEGGLLRHTRAAIRIAIELFRLDWWKFTDDEMDLIIVSLILHDGWKNGEIQQKFTLTEHPLIARHALENEELEIYIRENKLLTAEEYELILSNIASHMGQWQFDYKTGIEVLPKPITKYQKFVHLADYLASRKCLEMNFDVELSLE